MPYDIVSDCIFATPTAVQSQSAAPSSGSLVGPVREMLLLQALLGACGRSQDFNTLYSWFECVSARNDLPAVLCYGVLHESACVEPHRHNRFSNSRSTQRGFLRRRNFYSR